MILVEEMRAKEAVELLVAAESYYQQTDPFYAAFALWILGVALKIGGDSPTDVEEAFRRGLGFARQAEDRYTTSWLLQNLALLSWDVEGRSEAGDGYFREAAQLRREMGAWVPYAQIILQGAHIFTWRDGALEKARPLLEEALAIAEEQNILYLHAHALAELATHRLLSQAYEEVPVLAKKVLAVVDHRRPRAAWAWVQQGIALFALGNQDEARQKMQRGLRRMIECGGGAKLSTCLPFCGLFLAEGGHHERAVELLACGFSNPRGVGRLKLDPLMIAFRAEMENALGTERFTAAWERGWRLDPLSAAQEVLEELVASGHKEDEPT
jgi:tetratricopeptide (TPR) repeat protein